MKTETRKLIIYHFWLALAGLIVIISVGCFFINEVGKQVDVTARNEHLEIAKTASVSISAEQIKQLSG